jgi:uncharacterized membrane protein
MEGAEVKVRYPGESAEVSIRCETGASSRGKVMRGNRPYWVMR